MRPPFNVIYIFTNEQSIGECRMVIDDYARGEGTTRGEMRAACNMDNISPPTSIDRPVIVDASEEMAKRICQLSDALAVVALELNTDARRIAPITGAL